MSFFTLFAEPRLLPHLHLPLQSGSDEILRRMGRNVTVASYSHLVEAARTAIPDLAVSTDIIVGFPARATLTSTTHWSWSSDSASPAFTSSASPRGPARRRPTSPTRCRPTAPASAAGASSTSPPASRSSSWNASWGGRWTCSGSR